MATMNARGPVFITGLALIVITSCSSNAPPLIVCGTTLWRGASGAVTTDATKAQASVLSVSSGDAIYLRLSNNCQHGATLTLKPNQAQILTRARSTDGRLAAVAIHPLVSDFEVNAQRTGGTTTVISVHLRP